MSIPFRDRASVRLPKRAHSGPAPHPDGREWSWLAALATGSRAVPLAMLIAIGGCSTAPRYQVPTTAGAPPAWKATPTSAPAPGWAAGIPLDAAPRGAWWSTYSDGDLSDLIRRADARNQTLELAAANYRRARASARAARAQLFPTLFATGSGNRFSLGPQQVVVGDTGQDTGSAPVITSGGIVSNYSIGIGASWEPDLFGRIADGATTERRTAQAVQADLLSARLAIHGELAVNYFGVRATDELRGLIAQLVRSYDRTVDVARQRFAAGLVSTSDVNLAETQAARLRSDLAETDQLRAEYENAIAALIGENAASFRLPPRARWQPLIPGVPAIVPATLLQRRPDIAAAERRVAAANAGIGAARSAFFPQIGLTATGGRSDDSVGALFGSSPSFWSFGIGIVQAIFDGGARSARVAEARAQYDAAVAQYRDTVLKAFRDVQTQLTAQQLLQEREGNLTAAVAAARREEVNLNQRYQAGFVIYTDVAVAQQASLTNERELVRVRLARLATSVALFQAIGGDLAGPPSRTTPS